MSVPCEMKDSPYQPLGLYTAIQDATHVFNSCQIGQERAEIVQLLVMRVGEPRRYGYGVVRVEDVRCGGVVDDNRI